MHLPAVSMPVGPKTWGPRVSKVGAPPPVHNGGYTYVPCDVHLSILIHNLMAVTRSLKSGFASVKNASFNEIRYFL